MQEVEPITRLAPQDTFYQFVRSMVVDFYLDMLLVKAKLEVEKDKSQQINNFISSEKQKYLVFSVNNHSTDVDGIALIKAIGREYPQLKGKVILLVEKDRWSDEKKMQELHRTVGSFILFNRDTTDLDAFEQSLEQIKVAMDQGFSLAFFSQGTRTPGAEEKNLALNITTFLEKTAAEDSAGVMIVDATLTGLNGVLQKVPKEKEDSQRREVVAKRLRNAFNPSSWTRAKVFVDAVIRSRDEQGNKVSRGVIKNQLVSARKERAKRATEADVQQS